METDYVAIAYDVMGNVKAFTVGDLEVCKNSAKCYRRRYKGFRVYPKVEIIPAEEFYKMENEK